MDAKRISMVSGAALLALTASASAGPISITSSKLIAPSQAQTGPAYNRYYGYNGLAAGTAITGTAVGLLPVGTIGGWPYYGGGYSFPYSHWGYDYPYFGTYGYYGPPYGYYRYPYHQHYGYPYRGRAHIGRSIGFYR